MLKEDAKINKKNMDKCRAKFNYKKIEKNSSGNNNKTEEIVASITMEKYTFKLQIIIRENLQAT